MVSSEVFVASVLSIVAVSFVSQASGTALQLPTVTSDPTKSQENAVSCSTEQAVEMPCRCCKMDCWYSIAKSATHELGHVPGQAGEEEAMATLRLIRACMIQECSRICPKPRVPFFRPVVISE